MYIVEDLEKFIKIVFTVMVLENTYMHAIGAISIGTSDLIMECLGKSFWRF